MKFLRKKGRYVLLFAACVAGWNTWQARMRDEAVTVSLTARADAPQPGHESCVVPPAYEPAPPPPRNLTGRLGLWVAHVDPVTLEPIRAVAQDPTGLYPLASAYKQAVLWAVLKAVDAGRVRMNETFDVTHGNQSLGKYPYDDSNVHTLMVRMIRNSDNTATDILHRRVGLEAVQGVADALRLCSTRLILPTKNWWVAQTRLDAAFPGPQAFAAAAPDERFAIARSLDAAAQSVRADVLQRRLDAYFEGSYNQQDDLGVHNVSTPYEFAALMTREFLNPELSDASRAVHRDVMATGFGRSQLHVPVAYFGGKGGNGWKILTMTGYFVTTGGKHVVYVFMQHGSHEDYTIPNVGKAFAWINAAVRDVLTPPTRAAQQRTAQP